MGKYKGYKELKAYTLKYAKPSFARFMLRSNIRVVDWSFPDFADHTMDELFALWKERFYEVLQEKDPNMILPGVNYVADLWKSVKFGLEQKKRIKELEQQQQQQQQISQYGFQQRQQQQQQEEVEEEAEEEAEAKEVEEVEAALGSPPTPQQQEVEVTTAIVLTPQQQKLSKDAYLLLFTLGFNLLKNKSLTETETATLSMVKSNLERQPNSLLNVILLDASYKLESLDAFSYARDLKLKLSKIVNLLDINVHTLLRTNLSPADYTSILNSAPILPAGLTPSNQALARRLLRTDATTTAYTGQDILDEIDLEFRPLKEAKDYSSQKYILLRIIETVVEAFDSWSKCSDRSEYPYCRRFCNILDLLFKNTDISPEDGEQISDATSEDIIKVIRTQESSPSSSNNNNNNNKLSKSGRKTDIIFRNNMSDIELSCHEWKNNDTPDDVNEQQQAKNCRVNTSILKKLISINGDCNRACFGMDWIGGTGYLFSVKKFGDAYIVSHTADLTQSTNKYELPGFYDTLDTLFRLKNYLIVTNQMLSIAKANQRKNVVRSTLLSGSTSNNINSNTTTTITTTTTTDMSTDSILYTPHLSPTRSTRKRGRSISAINNI